MQVQIDQQTIAKDQELFQNYLNTYYAKTKDTTGHMKYGTAGFRDHAKNLPHVCLRVGIFTGLVAKLEKQKVLGITITASHNPQQDNGIKQTDFDGGMIRKQFEDEVSAFVIEQDLNKAVQHLISVLSKFEGYSTENQGFVFIGRDTRTSGRELQDLMELGIKSVGSASKDLGEVTTPMTHWSVRHFNLEKHELTRESDAQVILKDFFDFFMQVNNDFYANLPTPFVKKNDETIVLDCSNGIGSIHIKPFLKNMADRYNVILINDGHLEYLNVDVGAEFLHKKQTYPREAKEVLSKLDLSKTRCLSFDGDADRIVYFIPKEGLESLHLLDGDRIISLYALFFQTIFRDIHTAYEQIGEDIMFAQNLKQWHIGMVQTPYANGSSTLYLKETLKVGTEMSPNGVKNLHPKAHHHDIGIYCESNGHGTFTVSDAKMEILSSFKQLGDILLDQHSGNEKVKKFVQLLRLAYNFAATQNQINGDAMTNFLCIEEALAYLNLSVYDWLALYNDKKCKNSTVVIRDRSKITVSENQDIILQPKEVQDQINQIVAQFPGSRSFARPSGTEDIVRVYAEHDTMEVVDKVTALVSELIKKIE